MQVVVGEMEICKGRMNSQLRFCARS